MKESENIDKYLDFAREMKALRNAKVTIRTIVVGGFETVTNGELEIRKN